MVLGSQTRPQGWRSHRTVTNLSLAESYLEKAKARIKVLGVLYTARDYSDVVREAQEIVELTLKALLRIAGLEPPKWHDVGPLLLKYRDRFPTLDGKTLTRLAQISKELREERELAFYGDENFIPSEEYSKKDAQKAAENARFTVKTVALVFRN